VPCSPKSLIQTAILRFLRKLWKLYLVPMVGMQPPTTVGAAVGDRASDPSVQRLDDDPVTAYLLFRIGDRSCRLKFWQL